MEALRDDYQYSRRKAVQPLNIVVVGAGITGLTAALALSRTGHTVTVLESATNISETGAGLQISPNATRILQRLGVLEEVLKYASLLNNISIRRYDSDAELGSSPLNTTLGPKYGAPMGVIHRADLQRVLLDAVLKRKKCRVLTSRAVIDSNLAAIPRVLVFNRRTGRKRWRTADLVIAADGIRSAMRQRMAKHHGYVDAPIPTGDAAYRLVIPRERIQHDPLLVEMIDQNVAARYMGPGGHVMTYPLRGNSLYNIVLLHPDKSGDKPPGEDCWISQGSRKEMLEFYKDWSPGVRRWLQYADESVLEWSLQTYKPLSSWVQGSVALAGDACHPMLPYVAQGAANGIEDGAALATALTCTADVALALSVYQKVRKDRAEKIAASAATTGRTLHLPDGEEQRERDRGIAGATGIRDDKWTDSHWQDFMWKTDVMKDIIENWDELAVE